MIRCKTCGTMPHRKPGDRCKCGGIVRGASGLVFGTPLEFGLPRRWKKSHKQVKRQLKPSR